MEAKENTTPTTTTTTTNQPELFTASDVARFCQVDLKTIHNWADKGEIRHFRTPGRHLRFRRLDVLDFLRKYGYPIPEVLRLGKPKVVAVDDDPVVLASLRKALSKRFELTTFQDPFDALVAVGSIQPDAMVFDVRMPGLDGVKCLERLRSIDTTSHIRCIVYSDAEEMKKNATEAGAYDFIKKGEAAELRDSLERLMGLERE
ncbi:MULTISPECIES: response regulator [Polyangium]|uniref:Response regulator n=1 Tax=Polyangium jinanense TaxID=2829994 RepID=A0A9X3XE63_9BACT|nr:MULTISPECIES: response regulator [Polyangium]MDC3961153.1 response regulator [Polyangium jinanense]MDC3986456.1 response regulator [Polyangium jinanense]MDI1445316.1 response regulator [Polyangium sp. 6x1]MDI3291050.1 response regulator [Polyangium sp. 15x6]